MLTGLIIVVSLMVIGSLIFIFWDKIITLMEKKFFTKEVGSKIYKIALENDYYLINDAVLSIDTKVIHFNHILFTNKFIYCIGVKYFDGPISGKYDDSKWFQYDEKNNVFHINNPLIFPKVRLDYLRSSLKASEDLFVSLVLVNDTCIIDERINCPKDNYIMNIKNLKNFISKREKMDIPSLDQEQLEVLVQNIYKRSVRTINNLNNEKRD